LCSSQSAATKSTSLLLVKEEPAAIAHAQEVGGIKKEEGEKKNSSVTIMPLSCFVCRLNFEQRDGKFIYRHYCFHFREKLLGTSFLHHNGL
jgi:hypothetical protein